MTTVQTLVRKARKVAQRRGHTIPPVKVCDMLIHDGVVRRQVAYANCRVCDAYIYVDTDPAANGIDISGSAVATNCPSGN